MKTLRDAPLRSVPVAGPQTALDETLALMNDDPLKTVVLVGDGMFLGVFNEEAATSGRIPPATDMSALAVGPYAHRPRVVARPDTPVGDALDALNRRAQNVLPIVQGVRYRGVVTRDDLQKLLAAENEPAESGADGRGGDVEVSGY